MGPLNGGWTVAKRLLQHERQGISGASAAGGAADDGHRTPLVDLKEMAVLEDQRRRLDDDGRLADADLRLRLTQHLMEAKAFTLTGRRAALEDRNNRGPSAVESSILKNGRLARSVRTAPKWRWRSDGRSGARLGRRRLPAPTEWAPIVRTWLGGKAGTIAGGSYEVQNGIISKRILGLPDQPHANANTPGGRQTAS